MPVDFFIKRLSAIFPRKHHTVLAIPLRICYTELGYKLNIHITDTDRHFVSLFSVM